MYDWIVQLMSHEYRVKAENRNKALFKAVRLYKEETGDGQYVMILYTLASCTKIGGRKKVNA